MGRSSLSRLSAFMKTLLARCRDATRGFSVVVVTVLGSSLIFAMVWFGASHPVAVAAAAAASLLLAVGMIAFSLYRGLTLPRPSDGDDTEHPCTHHV